MVGAPVAAIMEAMKARQSMSRSPSRERTLSPQSTLRSTMSSRDISFDTDRQVNLYPYPLNDNIVYDKDELFSYLYLIR